MKIARIAVRAGSLVLLTVFSAAVPAAATYCSQKTSPTMPHLTCMQRAPQALADAGMSARLEDGRIWVGESSALALTSLATRSVRRRIRARSSLPEAMCNAPLTRWMRGLDRRGGRQRPLDVG